MPRKVDRFNVDGEDYVIEPVLDAVPTQGSVNGVESGGVYDALQDLNTQINYDKSSVPIEGDNSKVFTAGGAFDFFDGSTNKISWLRKVMPDSFGTAFSASDTGGTTPKNALSVTRGSVFVATTYFQGVFWSEDGKQNWSQCTPDDSTYNSYFSAGLSYSLVYANGVYVLLSVTISGGGNPQRSFYSTDGKVWHHISLFEGQNVTVAFAFKNVIICCSAGNWYWTEDGANWTACTGISGSYTQSQQSTNIKGYAFNEDYLVVNTQASGNKFVYRTTDGKTWEQSTFTDTVNFASIIRFKDVFVAPLYDSGTSTLKLYISRDNGYSWVNEQSLSSVNNAFIVMFEFRGYLFILYYTSSGAMLYVISSTRADTMYRTAATLAVTDVLRLFSANASVYCAVTEDKIYLAATAGFAAYSKNGMDWYPARIADVPETFTGNVSITTVHGMYYDNNIVVICATNGIWYADLNQAY